MNFREHIESIDTRLGKKLHHVDTMVGVKVYFYLAEIGTSLYYQKEIDNLDLSRACVKICLSRARDVDGNLLWKTDAERQEAVRVSRTMEIMKDVGSRIINYEKALLGDDLLGTAEGN